MTHRVITALLLLCMSAVLACSAAPQGKGYILTPPEFRMYLGDTFPVTGWAYSFIGFTNYPKVILHTDHGHFASSKTAEASTDKGSDLLVLDNLPTDFTGDVQLWLTAEDIEIVRISVPVVRPTYTSVVLAATADTARYTLDDQARRPIAGAPVLMRLKLDGRIIYAAAAQTGADGAATLPIPVDRFTGVARAEFYSYRMPSVSLEVTGKAEKTSLPTADAPVGVYAIPNNINANWCGEFPILVTAMTPANAPLPDTVQVNTYGAKRFTLADGMGMATIPVDMYGFETMPLSVLLFSGTKYQGVPPEKVVDVITHNPEKMKVDTHLDLHKGATARLVVTFTNEKGQPMDGLSVAMNFFNLPYQIYRTDSEGKLSVTIPSVREIENRRFTDFHIDTYAYHAFRNIGWDNKGRITGLWRPGEPMKIIESVNYDKKGQPTVIREK